MNTTRTLSITPIAAVGDALSRHVKLVTAVRPFAPPPAGWDALVKRLRDFRAQGSSPMRDKLIAAILQGGADEARISELRALAEAEAAPINSALMTIVTGAVQAELFEIYSPAGFDAYHAVARVFDDTAAKFAACATKVDVEADSETVVGLPAAARTAWIDAVGHAGALDEHLVVLAAAAELAGVVIDADELLLPLVIRNAGNLHRRKLCTAFTSANPAAPQTYWVSKREIADQWTAPRCGRWAALCVVGADIGAANIVEGIEPYRRAAPFDRREYPVKGQVSNRVEVFDPEDADYQQQLERGVATHPQEPAESDSTHRLAGQLSNEFSRPGQCGCVTSKMVVQGFDGSRSR